MECIGNMNIKKLISLSATLLLLVACNNNSDANSIISSIDSNGSGDSQSGEAGKGKFVEAVASYGENNTISFGDPIIKENFNFTLKYENEDVLLKSKDFDLSLSNDSTFTTEDITASLTWKDDETKKVDVTIHTKVRDSLKLLFIGNSFSDDTIQWMYEIATDLGIEVVIENMYIGGCSIDTHYSNIINDKPAYQWVHRVNNSWVRTSNYTLAEAIVGQDWDFISLQQASGSSGIPSTYSQLQYLIDEVRYYLIDEDHTQIVWNMTWAYQGNSTHADFAKYNNNQATMYEAICNSVQTKVLPIEDIKTVIPNGTSIQNARTSFVGDTLNRDGYHLSNDLGRYIAGLTALKALTGVDINPCAFSTVNSYQTLMAKESVNNAILNKFEPTNSQYVENPMNLENIKKDHHMMEFEWHRGFWNANSNTPGTIVYSGSSFEKQFHCTDIKETTDFPNGTIIYVKNGFKYRPEAWYEKGVKMTSRPEATSTEFIEVNDVWRGSYNFRAFNISRTNGAELSAQDIADIESGEVFAVYLPN